ncbi:serine/threonine protein kinase [Salipaludibacillus neizhouensis]|uniref:Serine/threonine protein kinase n=1 Tax=Salipaludibacillus neizhouensis TaxID=885475 RepID=A0A3A9K6F3_9BACI|nr:protein kinase [Salipaludibacillus neizhouensis]RKL65223.1 serine/threonine protein kinase [Salipaludibacillus neizhouensis]
MRDPSWNNRDYSFYPGQVVKGKWHGNHYRIVRLLGEGAIGKVYLAEGRGGLVAIKVSRESMSVSSEASTLRQVTKVHGVTLGPSFLDMDDVITKTGVTSFYVMEYIKGEPFLNFLREKNMEWLGILVVPLLKDLYSMHQAGWIFGDLKPENLIVTAQPISLRWIDVGGMTKVGRAVKEYTEFFDRGYWGMGDRKAAPAYDLFAVSMLMMNRGYLSRFKREEPGGIKQLMRRLRDRPLLDPYAPVIEKGMQQRYKDALMMKNDLLNLLTKGETFRHAPAVKKPVKSSPVSRQKKKRALPKERIFKGVLPTSAFASFLLFVYILYLVG